VNRRSDSELPPQTLRDRFRETTAQAILAAAEELFADAGLHAARMDEIAARAGVSVGTLYNHFEDRETLLTGLIQARHGELIGALEAAAGSAAGRPFQDRLRALVVALLGHCERHRKFFHIILQREFGKYKSADTIAQLHGLIDKVMKQGLKEKVLRPETADLGTVFLMGMIRALVLRAVVSPAGGAQGLVVEADRLVDAFLNGLGGNGA
jgi:AcrR family transcriptional regulator